tara:strand:+ start:283 stop:876 length:594 start_codon:yes stop_codon:yes gene_type:complete
MIIFNKHNIEAPYQELIRRYEEAQKANQPNIEAACLSTISAQALPHSRYVNIKYINNNEIIFFSNYRSLKASDIMSNSNIALNFFWSTTKTQIRIEGKIAKLDAARSDDHWKTRSKYKNALAISSNQSSLSKSYDEIKVSYESILKSADLSKRPKYWGGYSINPIYFEFWEGHKSRINKRHIYKKGETAWNQYFLQP